VVIGGLDDKGRASPGLLHALKMHRFLASARNHRLATRLQAAFRGYRTRKLMRVTRVTALDDAVPIMFVRRAVMARRLRGRRDQSAARRGAAPHGADPAFDLAAQRAARPIYGGGATIGRNGLRSRFELGALGTTVRAARGRLSARSVFLYKSDLYGAFVWARRALNDQNRRFPARAVPEGPGSAADGARPTGAGRPPPLSAPARGV
jgi:hypothetical protein